MMQRSTFGELPNNARFYKVGDGQEYEKITLTHVSERFPAWPESILCDRSLTNYRIPDATQPDHYFSALADQTLVCVEEEDESLGSPLSSCSGPSVERA